MARHKTLTFAVMHMSVAFGVVYLLTGSLALGGAVALIEPAVNTVAYFFHEKVWERFTRPKHRRGRLALRHAPPERRCLFGNQCDAVAAAVCRADGRQAGAPSN